MHFDQDRWRTLMNVFNHCEPKIYGAHIIVRNGRLRGGRKRK